MSGSAKRIKELQVIFDSPDRYGKGLDWTGYTVHDAANILRRYLNQLPQPIVPLDFYEQFRNPLRSHQAQAVGDMEAQMQDAGDFDHEAAIRSYQQFITQLPSLNRQLLLYILDLLAVFASKSDQNRMTSANLAAIFQPGLLSHPNHDMKPPEYRLSQDVIIFLIENQDSFLFGMSGTAADEKTVKEVQSGPERQPSTPTKQAQPGLGRSASNASGGADSFRKVGTHRNLSISSRNSRASGNIPTPGSPATGSPLINTSSGGGVYRSNTVPSKRSPRLPANRPGRGNDEVETPPATNTPPGATVSTFGGSSSQASNLTPTKDASSPPVTTNPAALEKSPALASVPETRSRQVSRDLGSTEGLSLRSPDHGVTTTITTGTPNKDRKSFFSKSPTSDAERRDGRQPNKLRKKHRASTTPNNASAQSSTHSLNAHPDGPSARSPVASSTTRESANHDPLTTAPPIISNTDASPATEQPPQLADIDKVSAFHLSHHSGSPIGSPYMKPSRSPVPSLHSRGSGAEDSEVEHTDEGASKNGTRRHSRWRLSTGKIHGETRSRSRTGSRLGSSTLAEKSESSLVGTDKPKKSGTFDSQQTASGTETSVAAGMHVSSNESTPPRDRENGKDLDDREKKGPLGWIKAKVAHVKEEREERKAGREAEREGAKSPTRPTGDPTTSPNILHALSQGPSHSPSEDISNGPAEKTTVAADNAK